MSTRATILIRALPGSPKPEPIKKRSFPTLILLRVEPSNSSSSGLGLSQRQGSVVVGSSGEVTVSTLTDSF